MYCRVFLWNPVWAHTVSEWFWRSLNKESFEYIFVICSVASKSHIPKGFIALRRRIAWWLRKVHHLGVIFGDEVIQGIRFKPIVHSFTLGSDGFFPSDAYATQIVVQYRRCVRWRREASWNNVRRIGRVLRVLCIYHMLAWRLKEN